MPDFSDSTSSSQKLMFKFVSCNSARWSTGRSVGRKNALWLCPVTPKNHKLTLGNHRTWWITLDLIIKHELHVPYADHTILSSNSPKRSFKKMKNTYIHMGKVYNNRHKNGHISGPTLPPHLRFCRSHCKQKRNCPLWLNLWRRGWISFRSFSLLPGGFLN